MKTKGRAKSTNIEDHRAAFGSQGYRSDSEREHDIHVFLYDALFGLDYQNMKNTTPKKLPSNTLMKAKTLKQASRPKHGV